MLVKDIATMHVLSVNPDSSIVEVAAMMRESSIGLMPVVFNGIPVGIVTDRDLVTRVVADNLDLLSTRVGDVMTPYALSISGDADIHQAESRMSGYRIRRLLVVDLEGRLVGVLSVDDLALQNIDAQELSQIICESACGAALDSEPSFLG